jgi:BMFP domain-containing protein YqiC
MAEPERDDSSRELLDEVRQAVEEAVTRWRGDASRMTERAGASLHTVFDQLGLVSRESFDELELRVAQLEHRLRLAESLLESEQPPPGP